MAGIKACPVLNQDQKTIFDTILETTLNEIQDQKYKTQPLKNLKLAEDMFGSEGTFKSIMNIFHKCKFLFFLILISSAQNFQEILNALCANPFKNPKYVVSIITTLLTDTGFIDEFMKWFYENKKTKEEILERTKTLKDNLKSLKDQFDLAADTAKNIESLNKFWTPYN